MSPAADLRSRASARSWRRRTACSRSAAAIARPFRRRRPPAPPRRILLLRLERIGDLLMALPGDCRRAPPSPPDAEIDLVVGSWNADLARRHHGGHERGNARRRVAGARRRRPRALPGSSRAARRWRRTDYDLAINFEPDVRSNLLAAASGAAWTAGYRSGGGGPLLDLALEYDTRAHTTDNAQRLVAAVFGGTVAPPPGGSW